MHGRKDAVHPCRAFCGYHLCTSWALGRTTGPQGSDAGSHPFSKNPSLCSPHTSLSIPLGSRCVRCSQRQAQSPQITWGVSDEGHTADSGASEGLRGKSCSLGRRGSRKLGAPSVTLVTPPEGNWGHKSHPHQAHCCLRTFACSVLCPGAHS